MFQGLQFEPVTLPAGSDELRAEVRAFVEAELSADYLRNADFNAGDSAQFSQKLGQRGWIGMTWPAEYGGQARSFLDRYVVTEELLAAGAPVGAQFLWAPPTKNCTPTFMLTKLKHIGIYLHINLQNMFYIFANVHRHEDVQTK